MKQTQTWSLAGEEAVSSSLARGKAAAVTRESGEIAAYSLAPWREQSLALYLGRAAGRDRGKTPKPLLSCLSRQFIFINVSWSCLLPSILIINVL